MLVNSGMSHYSDDGTNLAWQGAYSVTSGSADRNGYQYACLATPVTVTANARYGVSSASKDDATPAKWGRVYGYHVDEGSQIDFPCGEHISYVSQQYINTL